MALVRLELRIGGMVGKSDVQIIRAALDAISGIEAQDVRNGHVRLEYDTSLVDTKRLFATIAGAGEGYDVSLG